jgi:hypothetical protein
MSNTVSLRRRRRMRRARRDQRTGHGSGTDRLASDVITAPFQCGRICDDTVQGRLLSGSLSCERVCVCVESCEPSGGASAALAACAQEGERERGFVCACLRVYGAVVQLECLWSGRGRQRGERIVYSRCAARQEFHSAAFVGDSVFAFTRTLRASAVLVRPRFDGTVLCCGLGTLGDRSASFRVDTLVTALLLLVRRIGVLSRCLFLKALRPSERDMQHRGHVGNDTRSLYAPARARSTLRFTTITRSRHGVRTQFR